MPYKIEEIDGQHCVMKEDGEQVKCHETRADADAHMRAMTAAEGDKQVEMALMERLTEAVRSLLNARPEPFTGLKIARNHFLVTWSNNFEDREEELFTEKAIDAYVARVDAGAVPLPELWVWHAGKSTRIGQAAMVARHGHFLMASGEFDMTPKAQQAKMYYRKHAKDTVASHGYVYPAWAFDGKHYHAFNTFEITLLPRGVEANRYTSLEDVKTMALTDEKRKYIVEVFGEDAAKGILEDLDKRGKALEEVGASYKAFTGQDAPQTEAVKALDADFKTFAADLIKDSADISAWAAEMSKAMAAQKAVFEKQLAAQNAMIAALKEVVDMRPRSASKDTETEMAGDVPEDVEKQFTTTDPFWGTQVKKL